MVIDFSFLKDEMMRHIDEPCDHGFIITIEDAELLKMFCAPDVNFEVWLSSIADKLEQFGFCETTDTRLSTKIYVIVQQPTAESLAAHWFHRLAGPVRERSNGVAMLTRVRVRETPNCYSDYVSTENGT
tara:strand:- start:2308 stop:2694 length:387 start_codon:yes stop_codon:yes gene_type:complete